MASLALFPLPEIVVFPGMTVPLYIFEERYKQLVKDCLAAEKRRFVMVLAKPVAEIRDADPPIHKVGGFVDILSVAENADGTFNLLVHAQERCKLETIDSSSHPYYSTEPEAFPLLRSDPNLERVAAWDTMDMFRHYARTFFTAKAAEQIDEALPEDLVYQASFICANIRVPASSRQVMLEAPSLIERLQVAQKLMQERLADHQSRARAEQQDALEGKTYTEREIEEELRRASRRDENESEE